MVREEVAECTSERSVQSELEGVLDRSSVGAESFECCDQTENATTYGWEDDFSAVGCDEGGRSTQDLENVKMLGLYILCGGQRRRK